MTIEIPLTKGKVALVDEADSARVLGFGKWSAQYSGYGTLWYAVSSKLGRTYLHRFVLGVPRGTVVDHISGDGLDCRRANLRIASLSQNNANRDKPSTREFTSQYKGVTRNQRGRWIAKIKADGGQLVLGTFDTERDAACAYDAAARILFGEFARCNFPRRGGAGVDRTRDIPGVNRTLSPTEVQPQTSLAQEHGGATL